MASDLYGLQVSPYESLHVMYYTILRGKHVVLTEDSKTHKKTYHPECKQTLTLSPIGPRLLARSPRRYLLMRYLQCDHLMEACHCSVSLKVSLLQMMRSISASHVPASTSPDPPR